LFIKDGKLVVHVVARFVNPYLQPSGSQFFYVRTCVVQLVVVGHFFDGNTSFVRPHNGVRNTVVADRKHAYLYAFFGIVQAGNDGVEAVVAGTEEGVAGDFLLMSMHRELVLALVRYYRYSRLLN